MNEPLLRDFCTFARLHVESWDIDPTYPILKDLYRRRGYDRDTALWFTFLYVTWYRLDIAQLALQRFPSLKIIPDVTFPTGTERRAFRGNALATLHVNAFVTLVQRDGGRISRTVDRLAARGGAAGWNDVRAWFQSLPYGGQWSSYKWADLLKNVHDLPITAADIGVGGGGETAGPVPGMVQLTGRDWRQCARDVGLQTELLNECLRRGVPFNGLDQLETSLCDFNSLTHGRYYVGHDIDAQQEYFTKCSEPDWWAARRAVFQDRYLGEVGGWTGIRKELKRRYVEKGIVLP